MKIQNLCHIWLGNLSSRVLLRCLLSTDRYPLGLLTSAYYLFCRLKLHLMDRASRQQPSEVTVSQRRNVMYNNLPGPEHHFLSTKGGLYFMRISNTILLQWHIQGLPTVGIRTDAPSWEGSGFDSGSYPVDTWAEFCSLRRYHSACLFVRPVARLSAGKQAIVAEIFRVFPQSVTAFYMRSCLFPNLSSPLKLVITEQSYRQVSFCTSTAKVPAEPTGYGNR